MALQPQATRSLRRVNVKTPGARTTTHYIKRKPGIAKCAKCKNELKGIPRGRPTVLKNLPLSQKTVSRLFGGNLCCSCSRETIVSRFKDIQESPLELGQVCVKIAGRESGSICVIVEKINNKFVIIDGQVRRKKCNILHLKTLDKKLEINPNEDHNIIVKELNSLGYKVAEKKSKARKLEKEEKPKKAEKPKEKKSKK